MKLSISILLLFAVATAVGLSAQGQQKAELKQLMGPNFQKMSDMLQHILVDEDYAMVSKDAELIIRHARMIRNADPSKQMPNPSYFQNYANFLEAHATSLQNVADAIQLETRTHAERSEYLRPQAAMHFGQLVTMCVSCHNKYRQRSPR